MHVKLFLNSVAGGRSQSTKCQDQQLALIVPKIKAVQLIQVGLLVSMLFNVLYSKNEPVKSIGQCFYPTSSRIYVKAYINSG